jgi:thiamine-phosphate pyrophosphorylase
VTPVLVVVTDFARPGSEHHVARIAGLVERARPGSVQVQLRDHQLSVRRRLELGRELRKLTRSAGQWFAVNDRLDLWKVLGADGVHLGEASVDTSVARAFGASWISRAVHRVDSIADVDADAMLLSPIVEARHGRSALGLEALTTARSRLEGRKLFALGGVTPATAKACLAHGADGVAVVGAALDTDDPLPLLHALDIGR